MKTIILVQHSESEHHINGHIGAWQDWNLTERGRKQALRIGEWLKDAGCDCSWAMFVSPQIQARQTAEDRSRFRFSGSSGSVSRFVVEDSGRITARFVNHSIY